MPALEPHSGQNDSNQGWPTGCFSNAEAAASQTFCERPHPIRENTLHPKRLPLVRQSQQRGVLFLGLQCTRLLQGTLAVRIVPAKARPENQ